MKFPEKVMTYQQRVNITPGQMSGWMGAPMSWLDRPELVTPDLLARLSLITGVPADIWADDTKELPDTLEPPQELPRPVGRPVRVVTTSARMEQDGRRERVRQLIDQRFEGSQQDFALAVEMDVTALSHYLSGRRTVTDAFLLKIAKFLGISGAWLLSGEGTMVQGRVVTQPTPAEGEGQMLDQYLTERGISKRALGILMGLSPNSASKSVSQYTESKQMNSETKQRVAEALQVREEEVFYRITSAPEYGYRGPVAVDDDDMVMLPFIPVKARAGFDYNRFWDMSDTFSRCPVQRDALKPNYAQKRAVVIEVDGDSMEPELRAGHRVTAYEVDPGDWAFTSGVVAVRFREQFVIKRIRENRLQETGLITFHSDNPSGGTFSVPVAEIQVIWKLDEIVGGKVR